MVVVGVRATRSKEQFMPDNRTPPRGDIVLYQTEDGRTRVECRFADETLWLSQALIAELFQKDVRTINEHLQNIYEEGELDPGPTIRKFRIVRREGARGVAREIEHYNLDAIPAVSELNRIVTMWLDFAEDQARRRKQVFLRDWDLRLDEFLRFNDRAVLRDKGRIKRADADALAEVEYEEFAARRRAMLEAEGQRDHEKALEDAAKKLPEKPKPERPEES
jgi:hypothetical protein